MRRELPITDPFDKQLTVQKLAVLALIISLLTSCAPHRAEFSFPRSKKTPSSERSEALKQPSSQASGPVSLIIAKEEKSALEELIETLDATDTPVQPGMYRVRKDISKVTGESILLKTNVLSIEGKHAKVENLNATTGDNLGSEEIRIDRPDPMEQALHALVDEQWDDLYKALAPLIAKVMGYGGYTLPEGTKIRVIVKEAYYMPKQPLRRFKLRLLLSTADRGDKCIAFEVHVEPDLPKPFRIVYKAWGLGFLRQNPIPTNRVLTDYIEFGPASSLTPQTTPQ